MLKFLLICLVVFNLSAQHAPPAEAEALVREVIQFAKVNGKETTFKEVSKKGGKFHRHNNELYVFVYDLDGTVLAHGGVYKVGSEHFNDVDPDNRRFIQERTKLALTKGRGWHDYKFFNPLTQKFEYKTSYIELWDGCIFGAGIFKK
jgi:signal transduction histidine kinase